MGTIPRMAGALEEVDGAVPAGGAVRRALAAAGAPYREVVREKSGKSRYRGRFLLIGATVIAVDFADRAAIGAVAPDLKHAFGISNTQIGLLASAFSILGAVGT